MISGGCKISSSKLVTGMIRLMKKSMCSTVPSWPILITKSQSIRPTSIIWWSWIGNGLVRGAHWDLIFVVILKPHLNDATDFTVLLWSNSPKTLSFNRYNRNGLNSMHRIRTKLFYRWTKVPSTLRYNMNIRLHLFGVVCVMKSETKIIFRTNWVWKQWRKRTNWYS